MKYLRYTSYNSGSAGLSNVIMSIEVGVIMAHLTGRALVLAGNESPRANVVKYGDAFTNKYRSRVTDLIDLPVPWIADEDIDLDHYDALELADKPLWECVFYHPRDIDTSTPDFKAFAHRRSKFLSYTPELEDAALMSMSEKRRDKDGAMRKNLTFYSYFYYLDNPTRKSVYALLRRMRPKSPFVEFTDMVVKDLGPFNAAHIRRGDFKKTFGVTTKDRRPREVIEILDHHFDRNDLLVILTDEQDDPFFDEITQHFHDHLFLDKFILENYRAEFLDLPFHDSMALALLAQQIASESDDFVGSMTSTFTALIQRYRGSKGKEERFKFFWNEIPDENVKVERGRHPLSDCVPMRHGIMVEEHTGPYTWNRYNPRINPAWMREWPESFLTSDELEDVPLRGESMTAAKAAEPRRTGTGSDLRKSSDLPEAERLFVSFGEHQVAVITDRREIVETVQVNYGAMIVPQAPNVVGTLQVVRIDGTYRFVINDEMSDKATGYINLPTRLTREIVRLFIYANPELIWLHAGAAAHNDSTVLFAGHWGRGKSTLVMRLHERGWAYQSDDIIPLNPGTGHVLPFPQSPRLREASGAAVPREKFGGARKTVVALDPETVCREGVPLGMLVLPHYDPGPETRLVRHRPAMAVADLLQNCLSFVKHREAAVSALCGLVERLPTYRLTFNDSRRAAELVVEAHAKLVVQAE